MELQRGRFLIKNISELDNLETDQDGLKRVIHLDYTGSFEYEGNSIPVSRMVIEYFKDEYCFFPVEVYNQKNEQMFIYGSSEFFNENVDKIYPLVKHLIDQNMSLWEMVNHPLGNKSFEDLADFWWSIENDYFIFFGEEKKEIINYFINGCYNRDGQKEGIEKKLEKLNFVIDK